MRTGLTHYYLDETDDANHGGNDNNINNPEHAVIFAIIIVIMDWEGVTHDASICRIAPMRASTLHLRHHAGKRRAKCYQGRAPHDAVHRQGHGWWY